MANLIPTKITESGTSSSMSSCATGSGGDSFSNSGQEFIRIQNTHASVAYSVKITVQKTSINHPQYGVLNKSNIYNSVASPGSSGANSVLIGPFPQGAFNDTSNTVQIRYKTLGTGTTDSTFNALNDLSGTHLLKIEVLYI